MPGRFFRKAFCGASPQTTAAAWRRLETPLGAAVDPQALQARLHADSEKRITGVLLTHNETSTGVANDMAALAPTLRAHGAITLVDSVSGLGASEFRMDEWGYDAVATASQKAFAAPPGVAMVALSERARARLENRALARFYFDLRRAIEFSQIGQTPWTPPISILFALDAALAALSRQRNAGGLRTPRAICRPRARRTATAGLYPAFAARERIPTPSLPPIHRPASIPVRFCARCARSTAW